MYLIASLYAEFVSGSASGGSIKWESGSAAPQKTRPIPIPALNNMANQEGLENSGFSSGFPNFIAPTGLNIRKTQKITMIVTKIK